MADELEAEFLKGIEEFNRQEFFECHETLEALWNKQPEPERQFTQGIIQIAVGYYHLLRGNHTGAIKLFTRGLKRITPFCPLYLGIDTNSLSFAVQHHLEQLQTTASRCIDLQNIPKINLPKSP